MEQQNAFLRDDTLSDLFSGGFIYFSGLPSKYDDYSFNLL